jgi:hypothetical protein
MNQLWGMLNDLSFIISLAMISLSIPGIAQPIMSIILQFIYLDLFQTDLWLTPMLDENNKNEDGEIDDDEALNVYFEESGFQSKIMITNLGTTFIFIIINMSIIVF